MADKQLYSLAASEFGRMLKSKVVTTADNDGNVVAVLRIPRKTLIKDVSVQVLQGFTAASTGTVKIGFKSPDLTDDDLFFTDAEVASEVVGHKSCIAANRQLYCEKAGDIIITLAKGTSAADVKVRVFVDTTAIY